MPNNLEYSRMRLKRSSSTGATPSIPTSDDISTFVSTDILAGEFYLNLPDDKVWLRTDNGLLELEGYIMGQTNDVWTIELIDYQTVDFYAPYDMIIDNYDFPLNTTTIDLYDDGVTYSTGLTIDIGSKITIISASACVVNLNAIK